MNTGLELFDSKGNILYNKTMNRGLICGTASFHPTPSDAKAIFDSPPDAYGYSYFPSVTISNPEIREGATLLPYSYSFGAIMVEDLDVNLKYGQHTTFTLLGTVKIKHWIKKVYYLDIPNVEEWNQLQGSGRGGYSDAFRYQFGFLMPEVLSSGKGFVEIGYRGPALVNKSPCKQDHDVEGRFYLAAGWMNCLLGFDAMIFNTGELVR